MRNGNLTSVSYCAMSFFSSYRTYEEWKPDMVNMGQNLDYVLTVPMRNGNLWKAMQELEKEVWFLPYL